HIIERVLDGDTNSFNLLVWQWEKPIYNYIVRLIGDRDEAMDLCQDTFMKAFRELRTLKDRDHFSAWLYRIAHNTCFSRLRKDKSKVSRANRAGAAHHAYVAKKAAGRQKGFADAAEK